MYNYKPNNKKYNRGRRESNNNYGGDVVIEPYSNVVCPYCGSTDVISEMHYCNSCGNTW